MAKTTENFVEDWTSSLEDMNQVMNQSEEETGYFYADTAVITNIINAHIDESSEGQQQYTNADFY